MIWQHLSQLHNLPFDAVLFVQCCQVRRRDLHLWVGAVEQHAPFSMSLMRPELEGVIVKDEMQVLRRKFLHVMPLGTIVLSIERNVKGEYSFHAVDAGLKYLTQ